MDIKKDENFFSSFFYILLCIYLSNSQNGITKTANNKAIKNCEALKMVRPKTNPIGVNTKKIITNKVTKTESFINLFEKIFLLKILHSNLLLKQCKSCDIPKVANVIVKATSVDILLPII